MVVGSSPTTSVTMQEYATTLVNINERSEIVIVQITQKESVELQKLGHKFGYEGTLHHTYSRYKKYYLTESKKAMSDLNKIRKSHLVFSM